MATKLVLACDHGGLDLKESLKTSLQQEDVEVSDMGVHNTDSVDYPDLAHALCRAVLAGEAQLGILVCGTGIGMSIAANRHAGIRAALCADPYSARMAREHNDANVLCLGGRVIGPNLAAEIVHAFLAGAPEGGRHTRRIEKIEIK